MAAWVTAPAGMLLVDAARCPRHRCPGLLRTSHASARWSARPPDAPVEIEGMRGFETAGVPGRADARADDELAGGRRGRRAVPRRHRPPGLRKAASAAARPHLQARPGDDALRRDQAPLPESLDLSSLIVLDRERCSVLALVRFSQDVAEETGRCHHGGPGSRLGTATFTATTYEGRFTGNIIDLYPVGALRASPTASRRAPGRRATPPPSARLPGGCNVSDHASATSSASTGLARSPTTRWRRADLRPRPLLLPGQPLAGAPGPPRSSRDEGRTREAASLDDAVAAAGLVLKHGGRVGILVGPAATVEEGTRAGAAAALPGRPRSSGRGSPCQGLEAVRSQPSAELATSTASARC